MPLRDRTQNLSGCELKYNLFASTACNLLLVSSIQIVGGILSLPVHFFFPFCYWNMENSSQLSCYIYKQWTKNLLERTELVAGLTFSWWKMELLVSSHLACEKWAGECLVSKWQRWKQSAICKLCHLYICRTLTRGEGAEQRGLTASLCWPGMLDLGTEGWRPGDKITWWGIKR